jgi:hypothetical protein
MAYMNQEKKARIAAAIKPVFKKYGLKATLSVHNHSSICVNIKSGPIDFGGDKYSSESLLVRMTTIQDRTALKALKEIKECFACCGLF